MSPLHVLASEGGLIFRVGIVLFTWAVGPAILSTLMARSRNLPWTDTAAIALVAGMSTLTIGAVTIEATFGFHSRWVLGTTLWIGLLQIAAVILLLPSARARLKPSRRVVAVGAFILVAAVPVGSNVLSQGDELGSATSWYYWRQVEETIAVGHFPETTQEWGNTEVPFLLDYPGFTATASLLDVVANGHEFRPETNRDRLGGARAVSLLALVGFLVGSAVLARTLGADDVGTICAVALMSSTAVLGQKLIGLRTETLAYGLMLAIPTLSMLWLRRRDRFVLAMLGLGVGALALLHGVVLLVAAILLIATTISEIEFGAGWKRWFVGSLAAGGVVVVFYAVTVQVFLGGSTDAAGLDALPQLAADGTDPTFEFFRLVTGLSEDTTPPSTREITDDALSNVFLDRPPSWQAAFTIAGAIAALIGSIARPRKGMRVLAFALVTSALVWLVVQYFDGWDTYVPRRTGALRVTQLALGIIPVAVVAAIGTLGAQIRRGATIGLVTATVLITAFAWPELVRAEPRSNGGDLAFILDRLELSDDDVVLTNAFTEGRLEFLTPATIVLSGRAPYLEADLLDRANALLAEARHFFAGGSDDILDDEDVTVLIAARDSSLGTSLRFSTDFSALQIRSNLRLIAEDRSLVAYRVVRDDEMTGAGER